MNLQEAYSILELSLDASPDEAKKKYRELTKKYHPDVNKEEGAEDRFKKINEAYQCVVNGKGSDREEFMPPQHNPFNPFGHNPFIQHPFGRVIQANPITLSETILFREAVLGCKRELNFSRKGKCQDCAGHGEKRIHNGCGKCGGQGQVVTRQGNMIFTQTCDKCFGRSQTVSCASCASTGVVETQTSLSVTIPGGVSSGNILRLSGMGNYIGNVMGSDQFTDTMLHINVTEIPGLSLLGSDVVSNVTISLLESLQGTSRTVETIDGEKDIEIPPLSKNKEEITLPKLGVNGIGSHRVILGVEYPEDVSDLISVLSGHRTYDPDMVDRLDMDKE